MPELNFDAALGEIVQTDAAPITVSYFKSFNDRSPSPISLDEFLESVQGGEWSRSVASVRDNGLAKSNLPAVTLSGIFEGGHKRENMVSHSGLICMDFDAVDNPGMMQRRVVIQEDLEADEFCRAAFTSAGGKGLAVICRIDPERHGEAFDALSSYFYNNHGLTADKACRDETRLRFVSWDSDLVENEKARVFKRYSLATQERPSMDEAAVGSSLGAMTSTRREEISQALSILSPDVYDTWLTVGMAVHHEAPGMDGLSVWREWSLMNDTSGSYDPDAIFKKWQSFGRVGGGDIIAMESIFQMAYKAGWSGPRALPTESLLTIDPKKEYNPLPIVTGDKWAVTEEAPRDPIIDGLFDRGDKGDVIAPPKMKKSFFVLQMAMHVAAGRDWLGMKCPRPRKVLILQLEVRDTWMHRRFNWMRKSLGLTTGQLANLHISNLRGKYSKDTLNAAMAYIIDNDVALIVIDPLYKLSAGGETIEELKPLMEAFDTIAEQSGAAVVWVHHDAKGVAGDRDIRDRGAGSGVVGRDCDFRIVLTAQEGNTSQTVLDVMPRNFVEPPSVVVEFEEGRFKVVDVAANPKNSKTASGKRDPLSVTADEVFEVLKGQTYPSTKQQLKDRLPEALGVASGAKTRILIDSLEDLFRQDSRLLYSDIVPWKDTPNPAHRTKRVVLGWGTSQQFETERKEREEADLEGLDI